MTHELLVGGHVAAAGDFLERERDGDGGHGEVGEVAEIVDVGQQGDLLIDCAGDQPRVDIGIGGVRLRLGLTVVRCLDLEYGSPAAG
jgi:hypothetical protein